MGKTVREVCEQQGLTLETLIERSGVEAWRVQAIYQGRWTPRPDVRQKLAAVLEMDPGQIVWGHTIPIQHIYG